MKRMLNIAWLKLYIYTAILYIIITFDVKIFHIEVVLNNDFVRNDNKML